MARTAPLTASSVSEALARIVQNDILGALSRSQLARAKVMMGDEGGARDQHSDFLSLWKDADPDIPILKEARAEYANSQ